MLDKVAPSITILKYFKSNAIIVRKGAAIDIPAEVRGLPLPALQWMKDDVELEKPDEEKMTMETEEVRTSFSLWCISVISYTLNTCLWFFDLMINDWMLL